MRNSLSFFRNLDVDGGYSFPKESQFPQGFGTDILSQFGSLGDLSFNRTRHFFSSGSLALQEAFGCISKFAGAFVLWYSTRPDTNIPHKFSSKSRGSRNYHSSVPNKHITSCRRSPSGILFGCGSDPRYDVQEFFSNLARSALWHLWKQVDQNKAFPIISLAAAFVPPFDNLPSKVLAESFPLGKSEGHISGQLNHPFTEDVCRHCHGLKSNITWERDATEPKTGIKFPTILESLLVREHNPHLTTEEMVTAQLTRLEATKKVGGVVNDEGTILVAQEGVRANFVLSCSPHLVSPSAALVSRALGGSIHVLVATGFRSMRVIKIKSLKVYAFGLYVHPDSVCEKLGSKYASVPVNELKNRLEFYEDLLREDIHMTIRLVVNCNGVKINTVRDAFEKSLRNRLQKMNPSTDFHCLQTFGSCFKQDIPLPVGTTIDFRRTTDGELITAIGGKMVGAVHSKDLCRAFFDMYIGDAPVSVQAKEEIAENVADLIRRC